MNDEVRVSFETETCGQALRRAMAENATLAAERDNAIACRRAADARDEASRQRAARLEEALRGLVELKAMKGELLNLRSDPYYASQAAMLEVQYEQRKPLAWAKARTALAQETQG